MIPRMAVEWERVREVFHAALDLPKEEVPEYLDTACVADADLRQQVESLLDEHEGTGGLIDRLAGDPDSPPSLEGQTIGHYRVLEKLGEGGMGDIYKAEDLTLGRTVALKFLAPHLLRDPEARSRFLREIRAVGALDHPNICTLYAAEQHQNGLFMVMAYVDGPSLAGRIAEGPLPLKEALRIAIGIAEALREAHARGIVHRDIKPENILLTSAGRVKVLDFGLASIADRTKLTQSGMMLGTPSYMSPEQVQGKEADRRADIWALGCVLYEMVAGRKAFSGEDGQSRAYAVLHRDHEPLTAVRTNVPMSLDGIVAKTLAKDTARRYQSVDDLIVDLEGLREALAGGPPDIGPHTGVAVRPAPRWGRFAAISAVTVALLVVGGAVLFGPHSKSAPTIETTVSTPAIQGEVLDVAISPNGQWLAIVAFTTEGPQLWLRALDEAAVRLLPGTNGVEYPFWSPDSNSIAFFANLELKRIDVNSSVPTTICQIDQARGGAWNQDGVILYGSWQGPIYRVAATGGAPTPLTAHALLDPPSTHRWPTFLSDGRHYLFHAGRTGAMEEGTKLVLGSLDADALQTVLEPSPGSTAFAEGRLLRHDEGKLLSQPMDKRTGTLTGEPTIVAENVGFSSGVSWGQFSVSHSGALAFLTTAGKRASMNRLARYDRAGRQSESPTASLPSGAQPAVSPDGHRLLAQRSGSVWAYEFERGAGIQVSTGEGWQGHGLWSPAGDSVMFQTSDSLLARGFSFQLRAADGSGPAREVFRSKDQYGELYDWSKTGEYVLFGTGPPGEKQQIWALRLNNTFAVVEKIALDTGGWRDEQSVLSPDERWLAWVTYTPENSRPILYAARFPELKGRVRIGSGSATNPQWSADGKELFFVDEESYLNVADIGTSMNQLRVRSTERLFRIPPTLDGVGARRRYAAAPDGQSFVVGEAENTAAGREIRLVLNWLARTEP